MSQNGAPRKTLATIAAKRPCEEDEELKSKKSKNESSEDEEEEEEENSNYSNDKNNLLYTSTLCDIAETLKCPLWKKVMFKPITLHCGCSFEEYMLKREIEKDVFGKCPSCFKPISKGQLPMANKCLIEIIEEIYPNYYLQQRKVQAEDIIDQFAFVIKSMKIQEIDSLKLIACQWQDICLRYDKFILIRKQIDEILKHIGFEFSFDYVDNEFTNILVSKIK